MKKNIDPSFWAKKRVLITGHTGFKGTWLGLWLSELGAKVSGLSLAPDTKHNLFSQLELGRRLRSNFFADIRDMRAVTHAVETSQPEVVLHLAAQALVRESYKDPICTWSTNVQGSLNILEGLRVLQHPCAVVMVTTDKVYENQGWDFGYREIDRLGGYDPYSASKAAAELAIASWRQSFCRSSPTRNNYLSVATARSGNVIGGGDWAQDRIVPDIVRALAKNAPVAIRRPKATRPWQHVLEPLGGYLQLAEALSGEYNIDGATTQSFCEAFNFGPSLQSNRSVQQLVEQALQCWPGEWCDVSGSGDVHEAERLHLNIDKSYHRLGWEPRWSFEASVSHTLRWYREVHQGARPLECCLRDLQSFQSMNNHGH